MPGEDEEEKAEVESDNRCCQCCSGQTKEPSKSIGLSHDRPMCTDFIFLVLFVVSFLITFTIINIAISMGGDYKKVIYGHDMNGTLCDGSSPETNYTDTCACACACVHTLYAFVSFVSPPPLSLRERASGFGLVLVCLLRALESLVE